MSALEINLFTRFCVKSADAILDKIDAKKVQELLSFVLSYRDRPHSREALAALLWGDVPTERSKKYLRQGLWSLQSALSFNGSTAAAPLLLVDDDWVQINPAADYWLDTAEFERIYTRLHALPAALLDEGQSAELSTAVCLHNDGLLPGWYQDWCIFERQRYQIMCLGLLSKLMTYCELHERYEDGLQYGSSALRLEPACERTYAQMMRLHFLSGDRTAALRQYEYCEAVLRQELGVNPSHQTQDLADQIRSDRLKSPPIDHPSPFLPSGENPASLPEVLERLTRFRQTLEAVQTQLQAQIQEIERLLQ